MELVPIAPGLIHRVQTIAWPAPIVSIRPFPVSRLTKANLYSLLQPEIVAPSMSSLAMLHRMVERGAVPMTGTAARRQLSLRASEPSLRKEPLLPPLPPAQQLLLDNLGRLQV